MPYKTYNHIYNDEKWNQKNMQAKGEVLQKYDTKNIKDNTHNPVSAYALHILKNRLDYGNAEQTTEVLTP